MFNVPVHLCHEVPPRQNSGLSPAWRSLREEVTWSLTSGSTQIVETGLTNTLRQFLVSGNECGMDMRLSDIMMGLLQPDGDLSRIVGRRKACSAQPRCSEVKGQVFQNFHSLVECPWVTLEPL